MAAINHTDPSDLLGKSVIITEDLFGVPVETMGTVTGVLKILPGARLSPAIFVESPNNNGQYFHLEEIALALA